MTRGINPAMSNRKTAAAVSPDKVPLGGYASNRYETNDICEMSAKVSIVD